MKIYHASAQLNEDFHNQRGQQADKTYPKPEHHLHKPIRKYNPILQLVQARRRLYGPIPSCAARGTRTHPPSIRFTLVDEERDGKEQTEPGCRKQSPDLRVECGEARCEGVLHRAGHGSGRLAPGRLGHGDELIDPWDFSDDDQVDEGVGDEEDAA